MQPIKEAAAEFLAGRRVAVTGVSRTAKDHGSNVVYKRMRERRDAADYGREHGIAVIDGGCPCMFGQTADRGHKAMRTILTLTGNVPRRV